MSKEPDWSALPASTPPFIRELLHWCVEKDPRLRLRDISDAQFDMTRAQQPRPLAAPPTTSSRGRERLAWGIAAIAVAAATGVAVVSYRAAPQSEDRVFRASISPPPGITIPSIVVPAVRFAVSPDGRKIAFVGADTQATLAEVLNGMVTRLWVQSLDGGSPQALDGTQGAIGPFWSPDGRFLGFRTGSAVKTISLAGGEPQELAQANSMHSATWGRTGLILFSSTGVGNVIQAVPVSGGAPYAVTRLNTSNGETQHWDPFFLPDGRHFLYLAIGNKNSPAGPNGIYVTDLDANQPKMLVPGGSNATYAQGYLFFLRQQTLVAQPFDVDRLEFTGDAIPIAQQVMTGGGSGIRGAFSVSQANLLAYATGSAESGGQCGSDSSARLVRPDRQTTRHHRGTCAITECTAVGRRRARRRQHLRCVAKDP